MFAEAHVEVERRHSAGRDQDRLSHMTKEGAGKESQLGFFSGLCPSVLDPVAVGRRAAT